MKTTHSTVPPATDNLSLSPRVLDLQNAQFGGTGGVSAANRARGFRPAFRDRRSGAVHLSRFADGRPAPVHLLEGLPAELVRCRTRSGEVAALAPSVVAGFVLGELFFTRQQAADFVATTERMTRPH